MPMKRLIAIACGAALLAGLPVLPVQAGTLQVNPVLVQINAGRRSASVTIRNEESEPVTIRAYAMGWRQVDGDDVYEDSSAVIVSPPIFTIPAGGTQLIRVGLRNVSGAPQSYRLMIEEVPQANPAGGIRVALRLNLPLYSGMDAGDAAGLRWSAARDGEGWTLQAVNPGSHYVRLDPAAVQEATGIAFAENMNFGTVLPGAMRRWRIGSVPQVRDQARFRQISGAGGHVAAQTGSD